MSQHTKLDVIGTTGGKVSVETIAPPGISHHAVEAGVSSASIIQRCPTCGWPIASSASEGCVPGNCSMRPLPRLAAYESHRDDGMSETAALLQKVKTLTGEIDDILCRAYYYDEKPHQLFSGLRILALAHSGDMTEKIIQLMDAAYEKAGA